jgi:1-acyl-sn-glycerol-3-phosphate acyltransferase
MWRKICGLALRLMGWKALNGVAPAPKAIIIGVPHTSSWDFVISYLYYTSVGGNTSFVIKKEFFYWPLSVLLKRLGGIPIDRSKGVSVIKQIIQEMNQRETMHLAITPEGTRKRTKRWKAGFHAIAKATGAKVYLGLFDFGRKEIGWVTEFELSNDPEEDLRRMKAFYREYKLVARNPELFTAEE